MKQSEKVLSYIERHGSITPWDAFYRLKITRLAAVIFHLKKEGFDIITTMHSETKDGETVRWAEYTLREPLPVGRETAQKGNEA